MVASNGLQRLIESFNRVKDSEDRAQAYSEESRLQRFDSERSTLQKYLATKPHLNAGANLSNRVVETLAARNVDEKKFYQAICDFVFESKLLESEEERFVAFCFTLFDAHLPYRQFRCLSMDDEKFLKITGACQEEVRSVQQVAMRVFLQKTEEASAVLDVIDALDDDESRAVVLAHYLEAVRAVAAGGRPVKPA